MRLSEAMRLGAMLGPQCFGHGHSAEMNASCALGAAWLAVGRRELEAVWPWFYQMTQRCPVTSKHEACAFKAMLDTATIGLVIIHLNDDHRWTREAIADWVATVEPQEGESSREDQPDVAQTVCALG